MKKTFRYILSLMAVMLIGLSSCSDDLAEAPVVLPDGGIGTGEWDDPMTAYQCLLGSVNENLTRVPWVHGYIVGVVNTEVGNVLNERCAQFEGPFTVNTNLLIAMNPEEKDWEKCATVQLPSGSVRSALNLSDNPGNLGREVCIQGTTGEKYCGAYGMRDCSAYNWGDRGIEPVILPAIEGPFYQNFESTTEWDTYAEQGWKNISVRGGLSGWYVRNYSGQNYITVSAYLGAENGGPYEIWLITPAIDMSKIQEKTLEFETQAAYEAPDNSLEVYVMTDNDPTKSTNTKLNAQIAQPSGSSYTNWVSSGKLDLSAYNDVVYIGWRYYSPKGGNGYSSTYCIDNINVGNASEPETPVTPPPTPSDAIYEGLLESEATIDWTFDNINLTGSLSYVWSWKEYSGAHYLNASAYMNNSNLASEAIAYSPEISLEGVSGATVEFEHAAKFQTTIQNLGKFVIREKGTTTWTEMNIPTWPEAGSWKFSNSGKIDISSFAGKKVEIGFKYASTTEGADTWEIKNVKVSAK